MAKTRLETGWRDVRGERADVSAATVTSGRVAHERSGATRSAMRSATRAGRAALRLAMALTSSRCRAPRTLSSAPSWRTCITC